MDTPREIARDEYIQTHRETCETCRWRRRVRRSDDSPVYDVCGYARHEHYRQYCDDIPECQHWEDAEEVKR